jgi:uncharacterized membrane protein HdeD (DUF308 family)
MEKINQPTFSSISNLNSVLGIGQIALGILVIIIATFTVWLTVWVLGGSLILWGIIDLTQFFHKNVNLSWWHLFSGILAIGSGVLLLFIPDMGVAAISLILAILFLMGGLNKILGALTDRPANWGYVVFGGGLSIILGLFILSQWPINSFVFLGILVGIEILLNGWTLLVVGYVSRRLINYRRGTPSGASG